MTKYARRLRKRLTDLLGALALCKLQEDPRLKEVCDKARKTVAAINSKGEKRG